MKYVTARIQTTPNNTTQNVYAQAERYAETLNGKIAVAAENPSFGANYSFVRDDLRRYECISHAIYYRTTSSGILVLRILHGRMDPGQHLI